MPTAVGLDHRLRLNWSPRSWLIVVDGSWILENRVYNSPLRLNGVFTHEKCLIPLHRTLQEALVRSHLVSRLVDCNQFHSLASHGLSSHLGQRVQRNFHNRADTKEVVIRLRRLNLSKGNLGRLLE